MAISTTTTQVTHIGDGSTVDFLVPFPFVADSDLAVTVDGATRVLQSDYTVSAGEGGPIAVHFVGTPPSAGAAVAITRRTPASHLAARYDVLDRVVMMTQELDRDKVDRSVLAGPIDASQMTVVANGSTTPRAMSEWMAHLAAPHNGTILYVSPDGDDSNSGTSWADAKRTVMAAYDAIPVGTGYPTPHGGTIYIADNSEIGGVPGQGIWISMHGDQAPDPQMWRLPKHVRFVGVGAISGAHTNGPPQARLRPTGGTWRGPVIWITSTLQPMLQFENFWLEVAPAEGYGVVDLNAHWLDGTYSGPGGATCLARFDNCYFCTLSPSAPTVDIGWFFWLWFGHCTIAGMVPTAEAGRGVENAACVRMARTDTWGYAGNIYFDDNVFRGGQVVVAMGAVSPIVFRNFICENLAGPERRFTGDGLQREFALPFGIPASPRPPRGWTVRINDVDTTNYRVVANPNQSTQPGGTIVFDQPPPAGAKVEVFGPTALFVLRSPDGISQTAPYLVLDNFQPFADSGGYSLVLTLDQLTVPTVYSHGSHFLHATGLDLTEHDVGIMQGGQNGLHAAASVAGDIWWHPNSPTLPSRSGQVGPGPGPVLSGRHDGAARTMPLVAARFENLVVPSGASGRQHNFAYPAGSLGPDGSTRAYQPQGGYVLYDRDDLQLSEGDAFIVAAWASIGTNEGSGQGLYATASMTNMVMNARDLATVSIEQHLRKDVWQLVKMLYVVNSVSGSTQRFRATLHGLQGGFPITLFRPTVVHVPASAANRDELCEFFQHFLPLPLGAPGGGDLVLDPGQRLAFWDAALNSWKYLEVNNGVPRVV